MKKIEEFSYAFEEKEPVITINPGEIIKLKIEDCFSGMIKKKSDWPNEKIMEYANPCTGPIYVNGAEPGMSLSVDVLDIKVGHKGTNIAKDWGMLNGRVYGIKIMKIEKKKLVLNDKIKIQLDPMIGCIGTAPKNPVSTLKAGYFGGNMDINLVRKGSTVHLPVFVSGGLLYIGDLHALMGESEPTLCAIETYGEVLVKINLTSQKILRPRIETGEEFVTVAIEKNMETATKIAVNDMFDFLVYEVGIDKMDAHVLISAACNVRLGVHDEVVAIALIKRDIIKNYIRSD
ncbi:MAG: acetamidase/formamidase family protein [Candidatus Aenigmarchaeota archaeon]|nr:acetamidase/formamidase family protein [Candidatus Aenigmarchaeota archaeon]